MVRLALQNREGAVKLLDEDEPHHLVAERHGRERQFGIGTVVHLLCETVWSPDDEHEAFGARSHLFFKALGELDRGVLLAVFV